MNLQMLNKFKKNYFSQNGEDGVIEEICRRLQITDGWFCEFGAWNGKYLSNTYALFQKGWKGVFIEGDTEKYRELKTNFERGSGTDVWLLEAYVSSSGDNSLDNLLKRTPIPKEFDLLSIDIDGEDYHVWKGLKNYQPKIVIIEINSSYPPYKEKIPDSESGGASFFSTILLGYEKGYVPVCHTGNLFFIRKDIMSKQFFSETTYKSEAFLFNESWCKKHEKIVHKIRKICGCYKLFKNVQKELS